MRRIVCVPYAASSKPIPDTQRWTIREYCRVERVRCWRSSTYDEAEPLFREALDVRLRLYGEQHHLSRNSMSNLGVLYSLWQRLDEAAPPLERVLALELDALGSDHPDTLALRHNIAGLYRRQGRFDQAMTMHEATLESARQALGDDAWQLAMYLAGTGNTLQIMGQLDAADARFAEAEQIFVRSMGEQHAHTERVRQMRAGLADARAAGGD